MYKHGHYSKSKEKKDWAVRVTMHRYDGDTVELYYKKTEADAIRAMEYLKSWEPQPNEYFFGMEYEIVKVF